MDDAEKFIADARLKAKEVIFIVGEEEKLASVRSLAKKGFDELDYGQGTTLEDEQQLQEFIGQIGRRAAPND